jgi:hypothetical protein
VERSHAGAEPSKMIPDGLLRPEVKNLLSGLKDFQLATVEYVFRRLYLDPDPVSRFLIADEVGLGKTLVARGIIAKAVDLLWDREKRIDIVYICSNQEIAQQNIDRLNITNERKFQHASRATLLPVRIQQLNNNNLNFVSLTPNTSFKLSSQTGQDYERVVLYYMLLETWNTTEEMLGFILRGDVQSHNWDDCLTWVNPDSIDSSLHLRFLKELEDRPDLEKLFQSLSEDVRLGITHSDAHFRWKRNDFIGKMRHLLARTSLSALEPDLVILDEFQRFKYLLDQNNEVSLLAQELFNFPRVKVILLSATPYKMYTLQGEEGEDHSQDFQRTVNFLLNGKTEDLEIFQSSISDYRKAFLSLGLRTEGGSQLRTAKLTLETVLRKVIVRTERLAATEDRNGMLLDKAGTMKQVHSDDLAAYVYLDRIARMVQAEDQVEYWKSSSYPLNLMEGYKFKQKFITACENAPSEGLYHSLEKAEPYLLHWKDIQAYQEIDPANARLRALSEETINRGSWKWLWLPPSMPYYHLEGPFAGADPRGSSKALVFSAWRIVPKVISVLLSYEAERRMLENKDLDFDYSELTKKRRGLLNFAFSNERLTGMPVFCLLYPCLTLAREFDPLAYSRKYSQGSFASSFYPLARVRLRVQSLLDWAMADLPPGGNDQVDERWYWAALALLDRRFENQAVSSWLNSQGDNDNWRRMLDSDLDEEGSTITFQWFPKHIDEFARAYFEPERLDLGRMPDDLAEILALIAFASPAVCTLRAMMRITGAKEGSPSFLAGAARAGLGFRTLFNQPDSVALLQSEYPKDVYWKAVLDYGVAGNLQAVMDEYVHVLLESLGLLGHPLEECASKLGSTIRQAISLRASPLRFDEVLLRDQTSKIDIESHGIRCRYAVRFGDEKAEDLRGEARDTDVRIAFNSPFRPFVLATTSVGQEGLDFHQYCHRVVHWNLPSNPVDLEQREGRVHRYKGHVIRRNLAEKYGFFSLDIPFEDLTDPWRHLFDKAKEDRKEGENELVPYWIFEGGSYRIERIVPMLPLSREIRQYERLKKSLVAYRSVIGQARQEELINFLNQQLSKEEIDLLVRDYSINLSPLNDS